MSNLNIKKYLNYRKYNQMLLLTTGCSKNNFKVTSVILPIIHSFTTIGIAFVICRFTKLHHNNIVIVIQLSYFIVGSLAIAIKMIILITYRNEIDEIQNLLDTHFVKLLKRNDLADVLLDNNYLYRLLTWSFTILLFITTFSYIIMPMITMTYNHIHHIQPTRPILVYPTSYPWNVPVSGFIFYLHYFFEVSAAITIFLITISFDSMFLFFTFLMTGHLREMSYCITHTNKQNTTEIVVKKCVTQYSVLMKCRNHMERIYGPIILLMVITNAVIICSLMYQVSQMKSIPFMKGLNIFCYVGLKLLQTFMYSWCGSNLLKEGEEYRNAIYAADWYGNKQFMKAIIIMLKQQPIVFTACKFATVSVDIFTKILNASISYYFLLKAINQ